MVWLEIFTNSATVNGEGMVEKIIRKHADFSDWEKGWEWHHSKRINWGSILAGVAIFLIGLYWFGKELGWWSFEVPICPLIMIIIGVVIFLAAILKKLQ